MACGLPPWPWEFRSPQRSCRPARRYDSCRWKSFAMNEEQKRDGNNHIPGPFGARFAPIRVRGRWVRPGSIPQTPVVVRTRRKPLKTDRLLVFQFGAKMPSFRQVIPWPKTGTVWVIRYTGPRRLLRHGDGTVSIQVKSRYSTSGKSEGALAG